MIEIYISNKKLDLIDDIDVNFTYSSIDTQNPSAVKNSFSKTVSVPSTPNNDEIFGHIWRFDSYITSSNPNSYTGVYFDPHKRTPFYIMRNGAVVENGYCVLESISMKENEKTYNLNLFGGLGEFFFNLMYDEDGKEKNLTDLYWKWIPMIGYNSLDWESDPLTSEEENVSVLYRLNSANVCYAWPLFDPNDNLAYDSKSFICSDIMFVPMYYGYNNDFISNKILVNNYQRNNSGDTGTTISSNWNSFLPVQYQEDTDVYGLYSQDSTNSYGLLETPRDLDPSEARDFRVTNMPIAIRVSKLMNRISDPENNGGYVVDWHSDIKNSYWWKYGFILTDTPEYDINEMVITDLIPFSNTSIVEKPKATTYSYNGTLIEYQWTYSSTNVTTEQTIETNLNLSNLSSPVFNFKPIVSTRCRKRKGFGQVDDCAMLSSRYNNGKFLKASHTISWLITFCDGDTPISYKLCSLCLSRTGDNFGSGYYLINNNSTTYPSSIDGWETKMINYVNDRFGSSLTLADFNLINKNFTGSVTNPSAGGISWLNTTANNFSYILDIPKTITNLKIKMIEFPLTYFLSYNGTNYTDYVLGRTTSDLNTLYSNISNLFGNDTEYRNGFCEVFNYKLTENNVSYYKGLYSALVTTNNGYQWNNYEGDETYTTSYLDSTLYDAAGGEGVFLNIYKSTLLNNTKSPYKYLIDFAKMLNLRFLYDKNEKKITILPHDRYWINKTIDINEKVDVGREINVKHLFDKTKFIKFNLNTPDTWAETIYKKLSKYEYGEYIKDTGIQFNKESKNLLDGLMYSNSILWQNKSIYYDGNNLGRYFLPTPTNQNVFNWTLFKVDDDETKTLTRSQSGSNCIDTIDQLPKVGSFDKDNKSVKVGTTFVFYNGLVKNFTTSSAQTSSSSIILSPYFTVSDNTRIQQQLAGGYCYYYGFKADGDGFGTGVACTACAASWYVPYFSRDLYNTFKSSNQTWTQQTKLLASWDITEPENILYDDTHLQFITQKNVSYGFPSTSIPSNFEDAVAYSKSSNSYIFGNFWKDFINDFYDRNSKEITCYCKIEEAPEVALRKFYYFRGSLWIMTKIENYKLNFYEDNFSKVTLHKIVNKDHYLHSNKISLEEAQNIIDNANQEQEM